MADYQKLFDRVDLQLPSSPEQKAMPTDQRIAQFETMGDPDLAALLFQFGRYLMISGSRPGGQPLNLQGIWNKDVVSCLEQWIYNQYQYRNELIGRQK